LMKKVLKSGEIFHLIHFIYPYIRCLVKGNCELIRSHNI
jgi:hypothetical protein